MKKLLFLLTTGLMVSAANAQDLPSPSPLSKVEQVVGLTTVSIEYSRPSMKGRTIFGDLVPYDQLWRLGANASTKFTSSTDVIIGGKTFAAGTYSVLATPSSAGTWKIFINSDTELRGTAGYDESKNVVTIDAKGVENASTETLTINFSNVSANGAMISISWENVRVDVPFSVETAKNAKANIEAAIEKGEKLDEVYYKAASYYLNAGDKKKAMIHANKGIKVKEGYKLYFMRAQVYAAMDETDKAIADAEKALEMTKAEESGWVDYIQGTLDGWKK